MNPNKNIRILIPDGESHLLIHVLSCLIKLNRYKVYVICSEDENFIRHSRMVSNFIYYPETDDDNEWVRRINEQVSKYDIDVIMPILPIPIRRLICNKSLLADPKKLVALPKLNDYDIASNKWLLYKHLSKNNLGSPQTIIYNGSGREQIVDFPKVVKPAIGFGGGQQIQLLMNRNDLEEYFLNKSLNETDYILQEYIEGWDYSCNVLCLNGTILANTIQRSESANNGRFGPQMKYRFETNERIIELVSELMKSLQWNGLASVDVRYDQNQDLYKILEINPRFWRSLIGSLYAGVNFPHLLVQLSLEGHLKGQVFFKDIYFYDLKGYFQAVRRNPLLALNLGVMKRNTQLGLMLIDPSPYIHKFVWRTRNVIRYKIRKGAH